jgi:hypothetical protein
MDTGAAKAASVKELQEIYIFWRVLWRPKSGTKVSIRQRKWLRYLNARVGLSIRSLLEQLKRRIGVMKLRRN